MTAASQITTSPALEVLERTPGILRGLLAAATREEMDWRPSPERWSITMVLAHLADVEEKGFRQRFRAMAEEEFPFLPSYDQLALFRLGAQFNPVEELEKFERERHGTLEWLRSLPAGVGQRSGRHEELGTITVAQLLNEFAFHDLGHIRQVAELYRSRVFYPRMGPYQNYYKINQ